MDRIFFILFFFFAFSGTSIFAQAVNGKLVADLIIEQNFDSLSVYMANEIVINLNELEESFDKESALDQLIGFFSENEPTKFTLEHEGTASGVENASFAVGTLKAGELLLDTHFLFRENQIIELCFEE